MMASRFSRPSGDRRPIFTLPEPITRLAFGEHGVPPREVHRLQLLGQRPNSAGFDALKDSSARQDLIQKLNVPDGLTDGPRLVHAAPSEAIQLHGETLHMQESGFPSEVRNYLNTVAHNETTAPPT